MSTRRALHFVFKIGKRAENARFYRKALGMKFLRHEEFEEGCEASCNGPYDGKWSKSMVGFGPEDSHFVMELTFNYGIGSYKLGNDFMGITVMSNSAVENAKKEGFQVNGNDVKSPDGYKFTIAASSSDTAQVSKVTLACSDLKKSSDFWIRLCGMERQSGDSKSIQMQYGEGQCHLELVQIDEPIDRATAFGRFAISCPSSELKSISDKMEAEKQTILTPLISLDTPGKATVQVIIVADPDGHEICFVGDEAFRELSQMDSKADQLLDEAMAADKSDEWFAKKGKTNASA